MRVISPLSTVRQLCSMVHRRKMNGFEKQEILPCSYLRRLSILHYLLTLPNLFSRNLSWTKLIVQSDTNSRPRRDKISFYYKYRGYTYILLNYRLVLAVFSFFSEKYLWETVLTVRRLTCCTGLCAWKRILRRRSSPKMQPTLQTSTAAV